ncbi:efflux RND transporter periplasmic adaptor subunit [Tenuifilum thalassicum]|uniref:Efflux RND transporter periplasmic adaptor subunit n=1 Tax=Tenuifilum thalassicum TaxID=2590900 RepID=A0A7D3XK95_9BACT|nr:efflux RND transporter periplasmic adaptor subunit [Tenuifilum thalassicum]QKG79315.1 efflux RND transporter periplasmic adaptor subunit [Tenuifilum thalassicum]
MRTVRKFKLLTLLGLAAILWACGGNKAEVKQNSAPNEVKVVAQVVKSTPIVRTLRLPATIQAYKENHLAPATAGRVENVLVDVGDAVKRGQTVAILDRTNYQQAKIQFDKLKIDLLRADSLLKVGAIPQQQYDAVKMQYDIAKNNLEFLDENTTLRSPIDGVITGKYINDGELFAMSPVPGVGKPAVVSIMQLNKLKLLVGISSSYLPKVKTGMEVAIETEVYPNTKFRGVIEKVYPTIDNLTKNFTVEVVVSNSDMKLRPGMFATAIIRLGKGEAVLVPSFAVMKQSGTNERYAFVVKDGKAERRTVEVGEVFDDQIEIVKGIAPGEEIIVEGQTNVSDGQPVANKDN